MKMEFGEECGQSVVQASLEAIEIPCDGTDPA